MAWNTVDEADVISGAVLSGPEIQALKSVAQPAGSSDSIPVLLTNAISDVRSRVGSSGIYRLGLDGTIPDEVRDDLFRIVAYRVIIRLPINDRDLLEERRRGFNDAVKHLNDIAAGKLRIVPATEFSTQQLGANAVVTVRAYPDTRSYCGTNGLL